MESKTKTLEEIIFGASTHQIKIPKYQRPGVKDKLVQLLRLM